MAYLEDVVERGVEEGVFRDNVDAEETAEVLVAVGNGLRTRSVTVGKTDDELRAAVETYVETCLVNGGDG
ncbi:MAG: TetR family transcriptional regulator C-terminal domain-containing protein, partial [Halobacteriales archaeon]